MVHPAALCRLYPKGIQTSAPQYSHTIVILLVIFSISLGLVPAGGMFKTNKYRKHGKASLARGAYGNRGF